MVNIARSIITGHEVFGLLVHPGENSTIGLQFRGPQFNCTVSQYNDSIPIEYRTLSKANLAHDVITGLVFASQWDSASLSYSVIQHRIGNYTVQISHENFISYKAFVEMTEQSCELMSVLYAVDITYPRGIQSFQYSLSDMRSLPKRKDVYNKLPKRFEDEGLWITQQPAPQVLQHWREEMLATWLNSNEWALGDALGSVLSGKFYEDSAPPSTKWCQKGKSPSNYTDTFDCWNWGGILPYNLANYSGKLNYSRLHFVPELT